MVAIKMSSSTPSAIVQNLLNQQEVLKDHFEKVRALRERIAEREAKYGVSSSDLHRAIDEGRIEEDYDVCKWLIEIDRLERIEHAGR